MALNSGYRLGPYEIVAPLGAGGMGQVYRAKDTRLHRDVAIKVVSDSFAADPDRIARFQREAQVLASLNHPNIGGIHGLEEVDGVRALVLELVDGPTLADRIAQGPIPLDEAVPIARQIAEALEAAHDHGIIHRDLKPANIKVRPDGTVKVLDFGLAKALDPGMAGSSISMSPTITTPAMTQRGMILGTAAYMAPEQARGRATDKRADIWAFGCVLYEMLTGRRAFGGDDVAETIGAVIHKEPDWARVPAQARSLLERCLEKDPKRRLRDIGDAMALLDMAPREGVTAPIRVRGQRLAWAAACLFLITAAAVSFVNFRERLPASQQVRFQIPPPEKSTVGPYFLMSPDGRSLAFSASDSMGRFQLWVHSLESGEARPLPRAGQVTTSLVWSPDSRFIAFSQEGKLKKIAVSDGSVQIVCELPYVWTAGAWNSDDIIVFGAATVGLMKVPAAGGVASPLTMLNPSGQEIGHAGPKFLPDGRHFLYLRVSSVAEKTGMYVGSIDAAPEQQSTVRLLAVQTRPVYAPSPDPRTGYVLFLRDGALMAQRFDNQRQELVGEASLIMEDVGATTTVAGLAGHFSVSANGVLSYRKGGRAAAGIPVLVDPNGRELSVPSVGALDGAGFPRLSPDGRRLALVVSGDVWVYDLEGRPPIKLTFDGGHFSPLWTPDGLRLVYEATPPRLLAIPADGSGGAARAVSPPGHFHPHGWTPDGREILAVRLGDPKTGADIVRFPLDDMAEVQAVVQTHAAEGGFGAALSLDGRWLAYVSDVTGGEEVWVQPYPGPGAPVRVSPNGGAEPVWAKDGRKLFYLEGPKMMSVAVDTQTGFNFKPATSQFESRYRRSDQPPSYDVAPDGRFLMIKSTEAQVSPPISVVLNWEAGLKK